MKGPYIPSYCPVCRTRITGRMRRVAEYCPNCGEELMLGGYCEECDKEYGFGSYCPHHGVKLKPIGRDPKEKKGIKGRRAQIEEQLETVYQIEKELSEAEDLDALIEKTLWILKEEFSYKHGGIYLKEGGYLRIAGFLSEEERGFEKGDKLKISENRVIGQVARQGEPRLISDITQDQRYPEKLGGIGSGLAVPIERGAEILGVLSVESAEEGKFSEEDQTFLQLVASQVAIVINNLESKAKLRAVSVELEHKSELLKIMSEVDQLDRLIEVILKQGVKMIPAAEAGSFLLLNEAGDAFEFKAAVGWDLEQLKEMKLPRKETIREFGLERGPTITSEEMLQICRKHLPEEVYKKLKQVGLPPASSILLPVEREGRIIGCLSFDAMEGGAFNFEDLNKIWSLMPEIELAVERVKNRDKLQEMAIKDPLTGVYNRRYFNEAVGIEMKRSKRYDHYLSFLMIDINRFKEINERFGHLKGDEVLCEVADLLVENVRDADIVMRYGGDEFLVMMPETAGAKAATVIERLKGKMREWNEESSLLDFDLTLSIGISSWSPEEDRELEELLQEADRRMYKDKLG